MRLLLRRNVVSTVTVFFNHFFALAAVTFATHCVYCFYFYFYFSNILSFFVSNTHPTPLKSTPFVWLIVVLYRQQTIGGLIHLVSKN